jgi:oxygen-independent coproporphyrinogen-3 oxidase
VGEGEFVPYRPPTGGVRANRRQRDEDEERWQEAVITGLRLSAGIDMSRLRAQYGLDLWARYGDHLHPYLDEGWLCREGDRLWLSRRGMLVANDILVVFI